MDSGKTVVTEESPEMSMALGNLMLAWPAYEYALYLVFERVAELPRKKARVVWFTLANFGAKIQIMEELAEQTLSGDVKKRVDKFLKNAREYSSKRNKWTHWFWEKDKAGWSLTSLRKATEGRAKIVVKEWEVSSAVRTLQFEIEDIASFVDEWGTR